MTAGERSYDEIMEKYDVQTAKERSYEMIFFRLNS